MTGSESRPFSRFLRHFSSLRSSASVELSCCRNSLPTLWTCRREFSRSWSKFKSGLYTSSDARDENMNDWWLNVGESLQTIGKTPPVIDAGWENRSGYLRNSGHMTVIRLFLSAHLTNTRGLHLWASEWPKSHSTRVRRRSPLFVAFGANSLPLRVHPKTFLFINHKFYA